MTDNRVTLNQDESISYLNGCQADYDCKMPTIVGNMWVWTNQEWEDKRGNIYD